MEEVDSGYDDFRIAVPAAYKEVFTHFYVAENQTQDEVTKTLLPSYQTMLVFSFGTKPTLRSRQNTQLVMDKFLIMGPIKHAFNYSLPPGAHILVINFKDDAFYRFFGSIVMAEHVPVNPDDLLPKDCFAVLWQELSRIPDINDRVEHLLKFTEPYLRYRNKIAAQLADFNGHTVDPIKYVASENSQTERNIQLTHKKHFGYSAKELGRYQRFLKAIEMLQSLSENTSKVDWFEVINECGYYDQSHLIHDFKHFINITPAKYFKFQRDICNPIN